LHNNGASKTSLLRTLYHNSISRAPLSAGVKLAS
jgi:hypothetical protein